MGLAGPRRPIHVIEIDVGGQKIRGVMERVNDTVLVTTREAQRSAPLNGRDPEAVARDLLSATTSPSPPTTLPTLNPHPQAR